MLSIITIPLLMLRVFRFNEIPLTHAFLFLAGLFNIKLLLKDRIFKVEKSFYLLYGAFILLAIIDLTRAVSNEITYFFELKLIILLVALKLYSFLMFKYSINFFLKYLSISSTIILVLLLFRSIYIYNAPFFVVDSEQITESGKNQVAFYLALIIPCLFWYLRQHNDFGYKKMLLTACLLIHLFAAIYVQSKGLLITLIAGLGITFYLFNRDKIKITTIPKVVLLALGLLYFVIYTDAIELDGFVDELVSLYQGDIESNNSSSERYHLAFASLNYFADSPWVGIGTNNFAGIESKATHNTYLQILAENGFLGFILFISFFCYSIYHLIKNSIKENYFLLSINTLVSLLVYLFFINGFFNAITVIVLAMVIYYEKHRLFKFNLNKGVV
ncbi:O-antigen ligase [Pontibacter sp. HSC-36F09]|uniref:O-antigen ligase family protein n=1 Tax=Pontibacter sp. HSC-36F09 TaxID=2910966 RepID=UPI00209F29D7|nr:O-antigen ligase family protein [Pontibacter sp. HSC-36F09]